MTNARRCYDLPWDQALRLVGDPVDVVSGTQAFNETDFRLEGSHIPIKWVRRSDSRHNQVDRGVGYGFRLSFDVELRFDIDGITFIDGSGERVEFPSLKRDGDRIVRGSHELTRRSPYHYLVSPPGGGPMWEFAFDRDESARPSALLDADHGRPPVRLSYEKGLLSAMQVDAARRVVFEYTGHHLAAAVLMEGNSPTRQRLVRYQYDGQGQLICVEDAYGGTVRYEYDQDHRLIRLTDRRGYSFLFSYDRDGRCVHTRGEDGVEDYRFDYKPLEQLTVVTRGDGAVTNYYYDQQGSLVETVDACGGMTAYLKDESGRVVTEVDPNGNESEILYDERGQACARRDPLGHLQRLPADPSPHPLSHRLPENPVQCEQGDWPGQVRPLPEGVPVGKWLPRWLVDTWGESPTTSLPAPTLIKNAQGLALREERGDGKARRWAFDSNGYFRWRTDLDGKTTRYEYTSWNHLQREIDPLGSVTEYGYSKSERVASIIDPLGTRHEYGYDHKDRLVEVRRHGRAREKYRYDAADNLIEKLDSQGKPLLTLTVGPGNLMKQRKLASGDVQDFDYTNQGRLAKATNRAGIATFAYSPRGRRIVDERDGKGVRHRYTVDVLVETTVLGRFTTRYRRVDATTAVIIDPAGQTQRLRLVGPGLVERSCSNDVEELSQYDVAGRCLLKAAEGGRMSMGWARKFDYSGEGDLVRRDDTLRGSITFEHDDAHRLAKAHFQDGGVEAYVYDRAGNLLQAPRLSARVQAGNRLLEANEDRFTYNDRDHLAVRQGRAGETRYLYDSRDLLVGIEGPGLSYQAEHDGLGRRTKKTVNGQTWQYYWDTDRLAAEVFPDGRLRVYVYPDAFAWVPMLFLDYASVDADAASGKRYHVYGDHLGCPELILDEAGRTAWRARIDPYGTAHVDVGRDFHQPLRWPGHYFDAETGLHDNRFRTYSPELGRYLQSDPVGTEGGLNLYAYTENPLRTVDLRGNEQSCPEGTPNCPFKKEGGEDGEKPKGPLRDEKGRFMRDPNAPPDDGRIGRDDVYPGGFRKSTHDAMALKHTEEGKAHLAAHLADPENVPKPPPVCADAGRGAPLEREDMTWLDANRQPIDFYARDDDGNIRTDSKGRPITNLTYDHDPPMVQRYNDHGYDQTKEQRAEDYHDPAKLTPMSRSDNSAKSGGVDGDGKPITYRQDQGPNFTK